jgi:hypothetical protein
MKTLLLLPLLLMHVGCAALGSETQQVAAPPSAHRNESSEPGHPAAIGAATEAEPASWTRSVSLGGGGYAVVRRQRDAILVGTLDADRRPLGELVRIPARHVIGTPALAASGEVAIVIWAQGESTGCTSLVGATFAPGEGAGPVHRIRGTECNEDRSARAPILSSNAEGQFVLAFTEIGAWSSQPVAMALSDEQGTRFVGARASAR